MRASAHLAESPCKRLRLTNNKSVQDEIINLEDETDNDYDCHSGRDDDCEIVAPSHKICLQTFDSASNSSVQSSIHSNSDIELSNREVSQLTSAMSISTENATTGINNTAEDDEDDVRITCSNLTNPNIDYPHMRHLCGVHPFLPIFDINYVNKMNEQYCHKCYCYICNSPASLCTYWNESQIEKSEKGLQHNSEENGERASHGEKLVRAPTTASSIGTFDDELYQKLIGLGCHCNAYNDKSCGDGQWDRLRDYMRIRRTPSKISHELNDNVVVAAELSTTPQANVHNPYHASPRNLGVNLVGLHSLQLQSLNRIPSHLLISLQKELGPTERVRAPKDMRIPEVLLRNFQNVLKLHENQALNDVNEKKGIISLTSFEATHDPATELTKRKKIEGDIPTLSLHVPIFIEGIKIGWPYPKVMKPQRQIMFHIIRALKNKKHVVLESPTGTGKSAAILCSVLAWQRAHNKIMLEKEKELTFGDWESTGMTNEDNDKRVKIIYCSRTHSQVAQMVESLKSTPYRPRMAILGSRERLCIHKSIKSRIQDSQHVSGINISNECRTRVRNTEKARKTGLTKNDSENAYSDDDPPEFFVGDDDFSNQVEEEQDNLNDENRSRPRFKTCPHYRQLTTKRTAKSIYAAFVPSNNVHCCPTGGKKSKYGLHDIEDLVAFGVNPYLLNDIGLYRENKSKSYGLTLKGGKNGGCFIQDIKKGYPADCSGILQSEDRILRVNNNDVSQEDFTTVTKIIEEANDPLILDVARGGYSTTLRKDRRYSSHACCPYYVSQMLSKDADIVFAPYNYVLDPGIRKALGIELLNSIVVLDEAHNVEDTLREAGSGKFGEFELCDLIVMLNKYASTERSIDNRLDFVGVRTEDVYLCDAAHSLLLLVERIATNLRASRETFETNPGPNGAQAALINYEKFHLPDDSEFNVTFDGPSGTGFRGAPIGCSSFFERLGLQQSDFDELSCNVEAFEKCLRNSDFNESYREHDRVSSLVDILMNLVHKLHSAQKTPEHYFIAVVVSANGSLEFANGRDEKIGEENGRRLKKKPHPLPLIPPRTTKQPNHPPNPCLHPVCKAQRINSFDWIRHGFFCDGSVKRWQAFLNVNLLTPGPLMQELSNECHTVVFASGSLSPIPSLCAELNLFPSESAVIFGSPNKCESTRTESVQSRLQYQPKPLEADHVIDLEKQLYTLSIGCFPDGSELRVSQKNYSQQHFLEKLGDAIAKVIEGIIEGGVLVFFPSYALLRKCELIWKQQVTRSDISEKRLSVWDRLKLMKHNVIVEPTGGQDHFEEKKKEYMDSVEHLGGCVLFAVYRGKMSEGISFNDNNARGVICVGFPLPSVFSLPVKVKIDYNDEQRKLRNRTDLLPGREWYQQQAYRAIAQALGRCVRHASDYGVIILMDARYCDDNGPNDGIPNAHKNLPKWLRKSVKNLTMSTSANNSMLEQSISSKSVKYGYTGLMQELKEFFENARVLWPI